MHDIEQKPERAVLVCVDTGEFDAETSIAELCELAKTAGAEVLATVIQKRDKPDGASYIGSGKLAEIKELCANNEANLMIIDGELSPVQQRTLEDETDLKIIDRTTLILDIFAARARSGEGKLQVELAQLKYSLPRLTGKGVALSRLGGGIGTRGPGESKLESDRRHIRRRITALQAELNALEERRERFRARRKKDGVVTVALVGYTNAGKSTLMNALTDAGVLAEDKLFATLDPTARALKLPDGGEVMLIDTVGFVRRLPHRLVEAFKSTLAEAAGADIILNICDASSSECWEHLQVTTDLLRELGCQDKPVISVFNKCDLVAGDYSLFITGRSARISALTGEGLSDLLKQIAEVAPGMRRRVKLLLPFAMSGEAAALRKAGAVHAEEYTEDGIVLEVTAPLTVLSRYKEYFC